MNIFIHLFNVVFLCRFIECFYYKNNCILKLKNNTLYMKKKEIISSIQPKTENQELYLSYLRNQDIKILCAIGPAGTGKTFLACQEAINLLKFNLIDKIILTRPVVPVEEDIGFLPGNLIKKMDPWTRPIFDVFEEKMSKQDIDQLVKNNIIEISPLAYMRGRTFKNAFIIADEMQNSSPNQMLMLTTRIGENSKMIITGDLKQSDKPSTSGLSDFANKFYKFKNNYTNKNENSSFVKDIGIQIIELTSSDIQRSPVVNRILEIYEEVRPAENTKYIKYHMIHTNSNQKNISQSIYDNDSALIPKHLYKKGIF